MTSRSHDQQVRLPASNNGDPALNRTAGSMMSENGEPLPVKNGGPQSDTHESFVYIDVSNYFAECTEQSFNNDDLVCVLDTEIDQDGGGISVQNNGHLQLSASQIAQFIAANNESETNSDIESRQPDIVTISTKSIESWGDSDDIPTIRLKSESGEYLQDGLHGSAAIVGSAKGSGVAQTLRVQTPRQSSVSNKTSLVLNTAAETISGQVLELCQTDSSATHLSHVIHTSKDTFSLSSPNSPERPIINNVRFRSHSESGSLNAQEQACLEEIEIYNPDEQEALIEIKREEFQMLQRMEFQMCDKDKSNMLMTPQELEEMPNKGIEFEESVGPKPSTPPPNQVDNLDSIVAQLSEFIGGSTSTTAEGVKQIILSSGSILNIPSEGPSSESIEGMGSSSKKDATLVVKTQHGEQVLHINAVEVQSTKGGSGKQKCVTLKCGASAIAKATRDVTKSNGKYYF